MPELVPTEVYPHLLRYAVMAHKLQEANLASPTGRDTSIQLVDDPLCQNVTIYDCVERRFAGFSNALQQVRLGTKNPKQWQADERFDHVGLGFESWLYVYLVHRITGSGASFQADHGFRNSIIADLVLTGDGFDRSFRLKYMAEWVRKQMNAGPIFTSIGNQIPAFPKPTGDYKRGGELYLHKYAPRLCLDLTKTFDAYAGDTWQMRTIIDWVLRWHKSNNLKQFKFVLTAWVMDIAEYHGMLVSPESHCYFGANAEHCAELAFDIKAWRSTGGKKQDFYDALMDQFAKDVTSLVDTPAYPMSLEDVLCDGIRWMTNYIPATGYDHLTPDQVETTAPPLLPKSLSYNSYLKRHRELQEQRQVH